MGNSGLHVNPSGSPSVGNVRQFFFFICSGLQFYSCFLWERFCSVVTTAYCDYLVKNISSFSELRAKN